MVHEAAISMVLLLLPSLISQQHMCEDDHAENIICVCAIMRLFRRRNVCFLYPPKEACSEGAAVDSQNMSIVGKAVVISNHVRTRDLRVALCFIFCLFSSALAERVNTNGDTE